MFRAIVLCFALIFDISANAQSVNPSAASITSTASGVLVWGNANRSGYLNPLPGNPTTITVQTPSGATPTVTDIASQRYNHLIRNGVSPTGVDWVAWSSCATTESCSGEQASAQSTSGTCSPSPPCASVMAVPAQSPWSAGGGAGTSGSYISYPRWMGTYNGALYLVSAIDQKTTTGTQGMALVANQLNDDGTIGTLFALTPNYVPYSGFQNITYDPVLGPPLFVLANLFGTWGGSSPGQVPSSWVGYALTPDGLTTLVEPTTSQIANGCYERIWRVNSGAASPLFKWMQSSCDGVNFSPATVTDIPDSPSANATLVLPDGRILMLGNAQNVAGATARDPLYLAVFRPSGAFACQYAVVQHESGVAMYPNSSKAGGGQYGGLALNGTTLKIAFDVIKETVYQTSLPISGLCS